MSLDTKVKQSRMRRMLNRTKRQASAERESPKIVGLQEKDDNIATERKQFEEFEAELGRSRAKSPNVNVTADVTPFDDECFDG